MIPPRATAALPVLLTLALFLARTHTLPLNGDEPHYLVIADSVASDRDLNLQNNYLRDFDTRRIYGLTIPHVYNVARGWMPYHTPGLGVLLALPFAIGGTTGARVALTLFTLALSAALYGWLSRALSDRAAAWATFGAMLSLPIAFGAYEIYPDLPGGVVITALTVWLLVRGTARASTAEWAAFWLVVGFLPWLHVKFIAVAAAFPIGAALLPTATPRGKDYRRLSTAALAAVGIGGLVAFNVWAFGGPVGPRDARELTSSVARATMIFIGLHLDQSQGMFVQNPLLLAGVAALPVFIRRAPRIALFWALLYAAAIVPNALELARYGTGGPVGRFGWTAEWLWAIPAGYLLAERRQALAKYVRPLALASIAYQAALAIRWARDPWRLFPAFDPPRDSLFPDSMRAWMPSFYFWDFSSYWRHPPNVAAFGVVAALLLAGARAARGGAPDAAATERVALDLTRRGRSAREGLGS